ncbi:MAG: hypothetical protein Q4A01_04670 [Coriobacteriales bacterium]|nr:hypothetical protein [Coriobacteriales bacterium]
MYYTVKKGSAIVSLQPTFLATLAHGEHMLKASFDDGSDVEVPFRTVAGESSSSGTKDDDETGGTNSDGTSGGGANGRNSGSTSVSGNDGGSSSGTSANASGTSGATMLARTGDASGGTAAWLVLAAAGAFLIAAIPRGRRNGWTGPRACR